MLFLCKIGHVCGPNQTYLGEFDITSESDLYLDSYVEI
jgi:hypothetical protein